MASSSRWRATTRSAWGAKSSSPFVDVRTAGFRIIGACIPGAHKTGFFEPRAVVTQVVRALSSSPFAIFPKVFAVLGAHRNKSALPDSPKSSRCSQRALSASKIGRPVAQARDIGETISAAAEERTH